MSISRRGLCLVLAAPSGAGKSSITRALLQAEPEMMLSISVTTRPPRPGEQDGVHYHYHTPEQFEAMVAAGTLLEWARKFGGGYGSPRAPVAAALARGQDVMFDIDWQGFRQLRTALPGDVVGVFIMPPSFAELSARLSARGTDSEVEIAHRMAAAQDEMSHAAEFDHVLVNRDFPVAVAAARAVLHAARLQTHRLTGLAAFVATLQHEAGERQAP
jgi:guanylate kinase